MITVRVGQPPRVRIQAHQLQDGATVQDALAAAGIQMESGYEARVDGSATDLEARLSDGQTILLTKQVKGNLARRTR